MTGPGAPSRPAAGAPAAGARVGGQSAARPTAGAAGRAIRPTICSPIRCAGSRCRRRPGRCCRTRHRGALRIQKPSETTCFFSRNAMRCDNCHRPVPDDATIWRVSVGYSVNSSAVQSWCAACWESRFGPRKILPPEAENWSEDRRQSLLRAYAEIPHFRWHPAQACEHCGRPVIFHAVRRIPLHAVCGDACRYAVKLAQARARYARRERPRPQVVCMTCGRPFQPKRANATTCSSTCRQRAYRRQHAEAT